MNNSFRSGTIQSINVKAKLQTQRDNAVLSPDKSSNHESLSDCVYSDSELNYDDMITYKNLRTAYFQTIKGKQHRYRVQKFKQNFVSELKQTLQRTKNTRLQTWCTERVQDMVHGGTEEQNNQSAHLA